MIRNMHRAVSILLTVLLLLSVFTVLPVMTAGAASNGSTAWVFSTNDGMIYDLTDKYFSYNGYNGGESTLFGSSGSFSVSGNTVFLCGKAVADIDTSHDYIISYADSVYVTGSGSEANPFVFAANYIYGKDVSTVHEGATIAIGDENSTSTENINIEATAKPGDGFKLMARPRTGTGSVQFIPSPTVQAATGKGGLLGVSKTNYGYNYSNAVATNAHDFTMPAKTLYYLGKNTSGTYLFSEYRSNKKSFVAGNGETFTVTWLNDDGSLLDIGTYCTGEIPSAGVTPTKEPNAWYSYEFFDWSPAIETVSGDATYTAQYNQTPLPISVTAKIFPTNDGVEYSNLAGKVIKYNGVEDSLPRDGSFSEGNGIIKLCGVTVADFSSELIYKSRKVAEFAHTVYVTGTGVAGDPYIFTANYIYGEPTAERIGDAVACSVVNTLGTGDYTKANPGDGFTKLSRIRTEAENVQFLPDTEYLTATNKHMLGVGTSTYGKVYGGTVAGNTGSTSNPNPNYFKDGNDTLYYYGDTTATVGGQENTVVHMFSEYRPPYRSSFSDTESKAYTVTWKDSDGTVLDQDYYYYGVTPYFKGEEPSKERDDNYIYTFSGWTPAVVPVECDAVYTAVYTTDPDLFKGHSLSLQGDIGLNFFLDVTEEEISTGTGVRVHFEWTVGGELNTQNYTIPSNASLSDNGYYKTTCRVPAAEMNYNIHATVYINGVLQKDTDDYSVRDYADEVLDSGSEFSVAYARADSTKYGYLVDLVKKMLDYGAKAQTEFGCTDVALANHDVEYTMTQITDEDITSTKSDMTDGVDGFGLTYVGTSLLCLTDTTLRHYYRVDDDSQLDSVKAAAADSGFVYGAKDGFIYFEKRGIEAYNLDNPYALSLGGSSAYSFSAMDYCRLVLANSDRATESEQNLAMSLFHYNDAAKTFFNYAG